MPDFELQRLSARSFEEMVQALSLEAFGSGVSIFGDGPDGGREATFDGPTTYSLNGHQWSGYGVIQAKFRQRPQGTSRDGRWTLDTLEKELKSWVSAGRKADYFVFVTNVVLSPTAGTGALDKAQSLISRYAAELGLKGWDVWHYDKLRALLENNESVRSRYAAFILSGDVLTKIQEYFSADEAGFKESILALINRDALADQYAKLTQVGAVDRSDLPLANIFVDLPISSELGGPSRGSLRSDASMFAETIIDAASLKYDSLGKAQRASKPNVRLLERSGRCVLVGGPGQGKTTVSQFVCQLFRVAILESQSKGWLSPEVQNVVDQVKRQAIQEKLSIPTARRFPIRIVLTSLADAIAKKRVTTLVGYIASRLADASGNRITDRQVIDWLREYPWLIILDGLDEVPWSSNRSEVLEVVNHFWTDAERLDADVLAIATTRPQGYTEEFSTKFYEHLYLTSLDTDVALHCAGRLIETWHGLEPELLSTLETNVERAIETPTTARLMTSPLQVHIMTVLIDRQGPPPEDRYMLFRGYYDVIYQRELGKLEVPASGLLRRHRDDIDAIHRRIGLFLQIKGAMSGGTGTLLTHNAFGLLVDSRLTEVGWSGEELQSLRSQVMAAATERLVLLVPAVEGSLGFEVRSLQEFMAAEAITEGRDELILRRIMAIGRSAYWRNVFLLAVGRCRTERTYLINAILGFLSEFNAGDKTTTEGLLDNTVLAGSQAAAALLEDAVYAKGPNYVRTVCLQALELVRLPPGPWTDHLAAVLPSECDDLARQSLELMVQTRVPASAGGWLTLANLSAHGRNWADSLLDDAWNTADDKTMLLALMLGFKFEKSAILDRIDGSIWSCIDPSLNPIPRQAVMQPVVSTGSTTAQALVNIFRYDHSPLGRHNLRVRLEPLEIEPALESSHPYTSSFSAQISSLRELLPIHNSLEAIVISGEQLHELWTVPIAFRDFLKSPSEQTLSDGFEEISSKPRALVQSMVTSPLFHILPWPVQSCLLLIDAGTATAAEISAAALSGRLGTVSDWISAERRWEQTAVTIDELLMAGVADSMPPFDTTIASFGVPPCTILAVSSNNVASQDIEIGSAAFSLAISLIRSGEHGPIACSYISSLVWFAAFRFREGSTGVPRVLSAASFQEVATFLQEFSPQSTHPYVFALLAVEGNLTSRDTLEFLHNLAVSDDFEWFSIQLSGAQRVPDWLLSQYSYHRDLYGLARLAVGFASRDASLLRIGETKSADLDETTRECFYCMEVIRGIYEGADQPLVEALASLLSKFSQMWRSRLLESLFDPIRNSFEADVAARLLRMPSQLSLLDRADILASLSAYAESSASPLEEVGNWAEYGLDELLPIAHFLGTEVAS